MGASSRALQLNHRVRLLGLEGCATTRLPRWATFCPLERGKVLLVLFIVFVSTSFIYDSGFGTAC